jgi:Aerotolerance regulator N-terminal/von Willebrand factor type A domain
MSFLYPAFLIGALAVALPVLLHLLRRDVAPEVPFTAVRLLRRSPVERSRRRRLRDLLLLAARVAALLLLAAAFARPYLQAADGGRALVVAIDRSYSMSAPGRFERALELARAAVNQAGIGERVAVIAFDERPDVLAPPGSASDALAALEGLTSGYGATRYGPLIQKAAELGKTSGGRLVIVTDLQRTGWADQQAARLPSNWNLELLDAGAPAGNLAVTAVRVESDRIVASIDNSWDAPRRGRIRVVLDGHEIGTGSYSLEPGGVIDVPVILKTLPKGGLAVSIEDPGGLPADDTRYAALATSQSSVLIVSGGALRQSGFYLERALETAAGEPDGFVANVVAGQALSALSVDRLRTHAAVVLLSTRGLSRRAREAIGTFTREGGGLLLAAAPELEASVVSTMFNWNPPLTAVEQSEGPLSFAATDLRHPILRPFGAFSANLGQVRFDRGWRVESEGWEVIARFSDGTPALLERAEGNGRVVLFASDVDRRWNDFPLHPAFVPFTIESVRHAAGGRQTPRELTVGETPAAVPSRPGVYLLGTEPAASGSRSRASQLVAVNTDTRESALSRVTADEFREMIRTEPAGASPASGLQARQTEAAQSFWRYGLMLMLIVLAAESVVGRTR